MFVWWEVVVSVGVVVLLQSVVVVVAVVVPSRRLGTQKRCDRFFSARCFPGTGTLPEPVSG